MAKTPTSTVVPHLEKKALTELSDRVALVERRMNELKELFKDTSVNPAKSAEFLKFLEDHYSLLAMRYVMTGAIKSQESPDEIIPGMTKEDLAQKMGFVVSGMKTPSALDESFRSNPIVQAAIAAGADLTTGDDER